MYLSRIALNEKRRDTMRALASPHLLHGAVEAGLPRERQRNLWRIDWLNGVCNLLVLSVQQPDLAHIAEQFGYPPEEHPWESKNYDPLLDRLAAGQAWQFRLCANPVRSSREEGARGKVYAHVTQDQQRQWLLSRAESCGFRLEENAFDVMETKWLKFQKGINKGCEVTLRTAIFEGILTITDPMLFRQTLVGGIGRAKAYGCGLLTIARIRGEENGGSGGH